MAAIALDDRPLCEELLADLAPIAATCGVNGAVVAFAGSHGHVAGLLAAHLGAPSAGAFLADAAAVYERLGAAAFLDELRRGCARAGRPPPAPVPEPDRAGGRGARPHRPGHCRTTRSSPS